MCFNGCDVMRFAVWLIGVVIVCMCAVLMRVFVAGLCFGCIALIVINVVLFRAVFVDVVICKLWLINVCGVPACRVCFRQRVCDVLVVVCGCLCTVFRAAML